MFLLRLRHLAPSLVLVAAVASRLGAQHHDATAEAARKVIVSAGSVAHDTSTAPAPNAKKTSSCQSLSRVTADHPVLPETAGPGFASFVDPTVRIDAPDRVMIGCRSFVAPFASLDGSAGPIAIGDETNIQDNVVISGRLVLLGDHVIIAHGATIVGPSSIGASKGKPAFVGFNAYIDGAMIEPDAFVAHLARIAPGVVIHAGTKVLPGKFIRTQAEADDASLGKVTKVTDGDREFMEGVLHVNTAFADGYTELYHASPAQVHGVGRDPGHSDFNHEADLPTFAGKAEAHADFQRARIIGGVTMDDSFATLVQKIGRNVAIRADEGEHFHFGVLTSVQDRVTFHALEHTDLDVGKNDAFGYHVVVHGGPDDASEPKSLTRIEDDVVVRDWAVVFRSKIGKGSVIGVRAFVDGSHLAPGTVVPDRAIMVKDKIIGYVEW